jgi:threonyl-tRNA synthetase
MTKITLEFPDGSTKEYVSGVTGLDVVKGISEGLARATFAMFLDDVITDIVSPIEKSSKIKFLTWKDKEGRDVFFHTAAHVFAHALLKVHPDAKIAIGPPIENGFHYDFQLSRPITPDDLPGIEQEMKKIVDEKLPIIKKEITKNEALKIFKDNKFKTEMISEIQSDSIRVYQQGGFIDFCKGPHLPTTGMIKAFKLTKVSGAYWKGSSDNDQLQRVYGIAFPDKKFLKEYLTLQEEAEKRDHRKIGKEMGLYSFHEEAPGMPFFHDKGTFIWNTLVAFTASIMKRYDYEINKTPIILNKSLWTQSGHWDHYKDNMYFTNVDGKDSAVKPMNCPGNILIYKSSAHSYRELPIKAGEFGLVHRHELSGVLSGLFRVRCFTQDDAHVFCTEEQISSQIIELLDFIDEVYSAFGFDYHVELSTRPKKAMGDPALWDLAEQKLKEALDKKGLQYKINPGDGAFYGPKIDFHLKDAIGRTWQCGTIQLDFQMPEKFDLSYEGSDGKKHRPVMLHRAVLGSVERFMGILVEHYAGKFPLWLNPVQIKLIPIADRHIEHCRNLRDRFKAAGFRSEINERAETTSKKVREAQLEHVNYILVIGDKEMGDDSLNVRARDSEMLGEKKVDEFISQLLNEVNDKK